MCDLYEMLYTEAVQKRLRAEQTAIPELYLDAASAFDGLHMSAAAERMRDRAYVYQFTDSSSLVAFIDAVNGDDCG